MDEVTGGGEDCITRSCVICTLLIFIIIESKRRLAGHLVRFGEKRTANRLFMGKPEGKSLLGTLRRRWVDNM
jgi:hypothetical protein